MKQFNAIKGKYPDAILLFRVGDFYETFGQDAVKASRVLGIVLTKRANGSASHIELAGFPYHSLESYLPKLVRAGFRVAVCDQLEDPKQVKGIVKRGVTELVTPGLTLNDNVLEQRSNNFLCSIHFENDFIGLALLDISTGEFLVAEGDIGYVQKLVQNFSPNEFVFRKSHRVRFSELFGDGKCTFTMEDWVFTSQFALDALNGHFGTRNLKGFGIDKLSYGIVAAGAVIQYLRDTEHKRIAHISSISRIETDRYMWVDGFTMRNLEILHPSNTDGKSLLGVLDLTVTPMGARMMKRWLSLPLKERHLIERRLIAVETFVLQEKERNDLFSRLNEMSDLERIATKISTGRVNPRDLLVLKRALQQLPLIRSILSELKCEPLLDMGDRIQTCSSILNRISSSIQEDAPVLVSKGNVMKPGLSAELDELRGLAYFGKDKLLEIQQREISITGINSLKIGFNNVFGYYLEVTNSHKDKVPSEWVRKQTLVNQERYITAELKEYEDKILGAEEKILKLEGDLFQQLVLDLTESIAPLQQNAALIAQLDCLLSFARVSENNHYSKPYFVDGNSIHIQEGRHPVIERSLPTGEEYISNDVFLDNDKQQILIITGPNMSGKSALLRQTAIISIMAQVGCFVPAKCAELGIVDKVFSRVGASDNLAQGESTFMVEMNETASILNNMTSQSLIILDEIGRGTSTYDGISIAMSIVEYLHQGNRARPVVLFATHYHELNDLEKRLSRVKNFHVSVKEVGKKVLFLRKLKEGGTAHSFGIHVARMAGMPPAVVHRADEILKVLEASRNERPLSTKDVKATADSDGIQLSFFQLDDPVLEQVREEILNTDIDTLTPVEALMKLHGIKKVLTGKR
jgi:DNA mismatch repair protein MutS